MTELIQSNPDNSHGGNIGLRTFKYSEKEVRTKIINGEPWFCGKDLCNVLTISDHKQALRELDEDEKGVYNVPPHGNDTKTRKMVFVCESGLYSLIFSSNKPEAKKFKKWVTSEVLPAIRKTGSYSLGSIDKFLLDLPCQWEKTFPDQFFNNIRKLYGLPQMDHTHSNPTYFGKFILEYIYKPLGKDLPTALKSKRSQLTEENAEQYLHQFLNSDARQVLMTQIVKVNAVMHLSSNITAFKETWSERFLNENQLELYLR